MDLLKLVALDEEDLGIVSAHVQDAVVKTGDMQFLAREKRFVVPLSRFAWETQRGFFKPKPERRASVLHFEGVRAVKSAGASRERPDALALLALRFQAAEPPGGTIDLIFSGGAAVRLEVECIEARLADLGGAWQAASRPRHNI
jgi:hypothetical protein